MAENERKLTTRQDRAIGALLVERSVSAAAKVANVSESSLRRWLTQPLFRECLRAARERALDTVLAQLQGLGEVATETLRDIMEDAEAHKGSRVRAALGALAMIVKSNETGTISMATMSYVAEQMGFDLSEAIRETGLSTDQSQKLLESVERRWRSIRVDGSRAAA